MATKYNIDINDIRPKITNCIKTTDGSGNVTERFFVLRVNSAGVARVDYDKVLYELVLSNLNNVEPDGGTFNTSGRVTTNKRTHGNGVVDNGLALSPATFTIPANTSSTSTQSGTVTVTQYDGSTEFPGYDGASATFTWTQLADYPTSITITLDTPPVISAAGGSVNSVNYTELIYWKSGDITNDKRGTMSWNGVTVGSKGTTVSSQTTAGTLKATSTYTINGHTVTATASTTVYQAANNIESTTWNNPVVSLSYATASIGAGGGNTSNATASATQSGTLTYTSTATAATSNTSFTWAYSLSSTGSWSIDGSGKVSAPSRGKTTGSTDTRTVTATATGAGKTGSNSTTISQAANNVGSWYDTSYAVSGSFSYGNIPAAGGSSTPTSTLSFTATQKRDYTSGSYDTQTVGLGKTFASSSSDFTVNASNGVVSAGTWTGTTTRSATITATAERGGNTATATVSQVGASYYINVSSGSWAPSDAAQSTTITVTSNTPWTASTSDGSWLTVSPTTSAGSTAGVSATITVTGNAATSSRSGTITFAGNGASATVSVTQAAHAAYYVVVTGYATSASSAGTTQNLTISANTSWTLSSNQSWATLSKTSGTGNDSATLTIGANTATTTRAATITVSPGAGTASPASWTTTQAGEDAKFVVVTGWPSGNVSSAGTAITLSISANTSWALSSSTAWATLTKISGTGNDSSTLTIVANTATTSRSVTITVGGTDCTPSPSSQLIRQKAAASITYNWKFNISVNSFTGSSNNDGTIKIYSSTTATSPVLDVNFALLPGVPTGSAIRGLQSFSSVTIAKVVINITTYNGTPTKIFFLGKTLSKKSSTGTNAEYSGTFTTTHTYDDDIEVVYN